MAFVWTILFFVCFVLLVCQVCPSKDCFDLLPGQFVCSEPVIDSTTQQPLGCSKETGLAESNDLVHFYLILAKCIPSPGLSCESLREANGGKYFLRNVTCLWT